MRKTLLITSAIVLAATGCSSHPKTSALRPKASPTTCAPSDDACIPPDTLQSSTPVAIPALAVGKTMPVQMPTANGTAQLQVTLTGLKTKHQQGDAAGTQELCFGLKLQNTGTLAYKPDDITAGINWKWFGLDGQQSDPDMGTADECTEFGHQWAGMDQPAPLPGKWVSGYYAIQIPKKPGAVEITDHQGTPLFRLNYGPQSSQVRIDARGQ